MIDPRGAGRPAVVLLLALAGCDVRALDAGNDDPRGLLPVDQRNPVLISNDGCGSWQGLYAVLFASSGGPSLGGIAVNASSYATNLDANHSAWVNLITAARASGLRGLPDPIASDGPPLVRPATGDIAATMPNDSAGARLIVDASSRLASASRPLAVLAGGRLTDVADAYLVDSTVADRVVVVAGLGSLSSTGAAMGAPNGELDPWADWIVAQRFRYVQVSAFYDETTDIPSQRLASLPQNPLGQLIAAQQPNVTNVATQSDQVSVVAVGLPAFASSVTRMSLDPAAAFDPATGPPLVPDPGGHIWLVTAIDPAAATARLWQMLGPKTFGS